MKRFWILTFCDCVKYGFGTKSVFLFDDKEQAINKMKQMFEEKAKELKYDLPENYFNGDSNTYGWDFGSDYAYFNDFYYWDIFNTDLYQN